MTHRTKKIPNTTSSFTVVSPARAACGLATAKPQAAIHFFFGGSGLTTGVSSALPHSDQLR